MLSVGQEGFNAFSRDEKLHSSKKDINYKKNTEIIKPLKSITDYVAKYKTHIHTRDSYILELLLF